MEGKGNKLITALLMLLLSVRIFADSRSEIYSAYINNRMEIWKNVIDRMEATGSKSNENLMELINYQYGYIGYCLGFNKEKEAQRYLSAAEKNLSVLEKAGYKLPVLHAYRSAFYGFRISLSKISAPVNGPRSINHAKKSTELDSENYFGYVQMGNAYFYMPQAFGGSKKIAFQNFNKARNLMEKDISLIKGNWNYLSLLVTIAQSHAYLEEYEKAKAEYENILKLEPGFLYVKNDLYPELLEKMKK
jgi:tetratricopeptide (TPR) repeat protein